MGLSMISEGLSMSFLPPVFPHFQNVMERFIPDPAHHRKEDGSVPLGQLQRENLV